MLLAIDVGNSETLIGLFTGDVPGSTWRVTSSPRQTGDELAVLLNSLLRSEKIDVEAVTGIVVSSVVPELSASYRAAGERLFSQEPLLVDHRSVPDVPILYHDPASVGADRLVNAVAVMEGYGRPAVVVDLGTATTLDVVNEKGEYAGGVIAPGVATAAAALFNRGARLARVEVRRPERVVGRTTEESMQAGIFYGAVGGVDALVDAVFREQGFPAGCPVVATGGLSRAIGEASRVITHVDEFLTLTGLRLVFERVSSKKKG